jgi:hypothetical protein
LASVSHITIIYSQIIDVSTLYKSTIHSRGIPCTNMYNTIFNTFEIDKGAHTNILACDFKNGCNYSKRV